MSLMEVLLAAAATYVVLLLVLEAVIWKLQPAMDNGVTLFVGKGDETFSRTLYGFDYQGRLYVSSNHWFRRWYYAILDNPDLEVEHAGARKPCRAVPIEGEERDEIAREYQMRFFLRLMCGFAPRRYLRLDPRDDETQ